MDFSEADLVLACDWDGRPEWSRMDFQILLLVLSPQGNYLKGPRLFPPLLVSIIMILQLLDQVRFVQIEI